MILANKKGFTLVELMVTVGIFVLMTALLLARYNSYYSGTIFTNTAYDIALTIRQAQSYGISVKASEDANFSYAYGVRFNLSETNGPKQFSFAKYSNVSSGSYINDSDFVLEKLYRLRHGAYISKICRGVDCTVTKLDIIFLRPNPNPYMCNQSNPCVSGDNYSVELISGDGSSKRTISINGVGKITID